MHTSIQLRVPFTLSEVAIIMIHACTYLSSGYFLAESYYWHLDSDMHSSPFSVWWTVCYQYLVEWWSLEDQLFPTHSLWCTRTRTELLWMCWMVLEYIQQPLKRRCIYLWRLLWLRMLHEIAGAGWRCPLSPQWDLLMRRWWCCQDHLQLCRGSSGHW